jgi:hypothetical protein
MLFTTWILILFDLGLASCLMGLILVQAFKFSRRQKSAEKSQ